ncbi:MAG TPA: hypothetical protein VNL73_07510 [Verrucomicrobiae bacterium]|nr:hypothetical protein [Verrucomicrobiae bacterium]
MKRLFNRNTFFLLITGVLFLSLTPDIVAQFYPYTIEHSPAKPAIGESLSVRVEATFGSTCWYGLVFDSTVVNDSIINIFSTAYYSCPPICICYDMTRTYEFKTTIRSFLTPGNFTIVSVISVSPPGNGGPTVQSCEFTVGESPIIDGDLNGDKLLSAADVVLELMCFYANSPPPAGLPSCDINGNGITDYYDAIGLINAVFLDEIIWQYCSP